MEEVKDIILKILGKSDIKENYKLKMWKTAYNHSNSDLLLNNLKKFQVDIMFTKKKVYLENLEEIKRNDLYFYSK